MNSYQKLSYFRHLRACMKIAGRQAQFVSKVNLAFFSYFLFILSFEILHFRPIERIFCLLTTFCVGKNWISEVFLLKNELHNQTWYLKRTLVVVVLLSVISIHHTSQSSIPHWTRIQKQFFKSGILEKRKISELCNFKFYSQMKTAQTFKPLRKKIHIRPFWAIYNHFENST